MTWAFDDKEDLVFFKTRREAILHAIDAAARDGAGSVWVHKEWCESVDPENCDCVPDLISVTETGTPQ